MAQRLRDTKRLNANGILQYKTPRISARKNDGNGKTDKRGFRQAG